MPGVPFSLLSAMAQFQQLHKIQNILLLVELNDLALILEFPHYIEIWVIILLKLYQYGTRE